jgi:hypothetical protein
MRRDAESVLGVREESSLFEVQRKNDYALWGRGGVVRVKSGWMMQVQGRVCAMTPISKWEKQQRAEKKMYE